MAEKEVEINGEPFNIGPNAEQNHTVLELLKMVSNFWKSAKQAAQFEVEANTAFHEAGLLKLNCDKALFYLKWKPALEFAETARFTGEWYNDFYNDAKHNVWAYTLKQIEAYTLAARNKSIAWTE